MEAEEVTVDPIDEETLRKESTPIAPGVMLPKRFTARAALDGAQVEVEIRTLPVGAVAHRVMVTDDSAHGVTSEMIRKVPVASIVKAAARIAVWVLDADGVVYAHRNSSISRVVLDEWPNGDLDMFLGEVAAIYLAADALGEGPTAAVARAAGASRATAGRYVDAARKRGLLPPAPKRSKEEPPKAPVDLDAYEISLPEQYLDRLNDRIGRARYQNGEAI